MHFTVRALRYAWASPYSFAGLLLACVALVLGATVRIRSGALEVAGGRLGRWTNRLPRTLRFLAVTLGHVIFGVDGAVLDSHRAHEHAHVRQYERWGIFFIPLYLASSLVQLLRGRDPYAENRFEREAAADARAGSSPTRLTEQG